MNAPTPSTYNAFQAAYDHFNRELFEGRLPPCLITLRGGKKCYGYFSPSRFRTAGGETTDEIAMNPSQLLTSPLAETLSTLVHEMTHLEHEHFGKPPRRAYHNRAWADLMERVGLIPSDTGQPGGRKTGQHMSHYIQEAGPFALSFARLEAAGFRLDWTEAPGEEKTTKSGKRAKYECEHCGAAAWGKAGLNLMCGDCHEPMTCDAPEAEA